MVQGAILKACELVPKAYHQQFCGSRKEELETFEEFATIKEDLFDHWPGVALKMLASINVA